MSKREKFKPETTPIDRNRPISIFEIHDQTFSDADGVPLSSDRAIPGLLRGINFEYQPNPFVNSPSRYPDGFPHATPVSNLERKRLGNSMDEMQGIMFELRRGFVKVFRKDEDKDKPLNVAEAVDFSSQLAYLPHYLVYRRNKPFAPQGELPVSVVALSNSASGTRAALAFYLEGFLREGFNPSELNPNVDKVIEESESKGNMIGQNTVCAASPKQMHDFINAVINGPQNPGHLPEAHFLEGEEVESFLTFGRSAFYLSIAMKMFNDADEQTFVDILELLSTEGTLSAYVAAKRYFQSFERYLEKLNQLQASINNILGRKQAKTPITGKELESFQLLKTPNLIRDISKAIK